MEIFRNKSLSKKLILVFLIVIFLWMMLPNVSHGLVAEIGGKLLQPVCDLLVAFGDAIMNVMQKSIVGSGGDISVDLTGKTGAIAKILGIFVAVIVIVALSIVTGGIAAWIGTLSGFLGTVLGAVATSGITTFIISAATLGIAGLTGITVANAFAGKNLPDITMLPTFCIGPEEIFEGKLLVFDVNFFNPKQVYVEFEDGTSDIKIQNYDTYMAKHQDAKVKRYYYKDTSVEGGRVTTSKQNIALQLSSTISRWYYSIRNIALVFMMLILVYIGIRMMLSSVAAEKSKYKKMFSDWVVSVCLVFLLHYIMIFLVSINDNVIEVIRTETEQKQSVYVIKFDDDMDDERKSSFMKSLHEKTEGDFNANYVDESGNSFMTAEDDPTKESNVKKAKGIVWVTNLTGRIRISSQNQDGTTEYLGYAVAYLVLVFYTVFFTFTYLKRVLYMAFLTIIAPLVAMTYSIDKIADGKAQAFNMWLKEYIFNLLIQPMHLLLYLVLISMAYELAATNIVYTLVAIGFMIPAEKFVRKMFGFEKAQTPGMLGGAAGAALTMGGMQKLAHMAGHGPGPKGGNKPVEKLDKSKDEGDSVSGKGIDFLAGQINGKNTGLPSGGASAADANINANDSLDPVTRAEKEALEEKIADGQINKNELSDSQKKLIGLEDDQTSTGNGENLSGTQQQEDSKPIRFARLRNGVNSVRSGVNNGINNVKTKTKALGSAVSNSKAGRSIKFAAGKIAKPVKFTARKAAENKEAISRTIKGGTRLLGTAVGASIGAAAGIASGDISKVGQDIAIGATAGKSISTGANNFVGGGINSIGNNFKEAKTRADQNKYGEDYKEHIKQKQKQEFLNNKENRRFFANERSKELVDANGNKLNGKERKEKIDQIMEQAYQYKEVAGVKDNKIIAKAMKLDRTNPTSYESMTAALMASKAKDIKGLETYQKRIAKQVGDTKASGNCG